MEERAQFCNLGFIKIMMLFEAGESSGIKTQELDPGGCSQENAEERHDIRVTAGKLGEPEIHGILQVRKKAANASHGVYATHYKNSHLAQILDYHLKLQFNFNLGLSRQSCHLREPKASEALKTSNF